MYGKKSKMNHIFQVNLLFINPVFDRNERACFIYVKIEKQVKAPAEEEKEVRNLLNLY